MKCMTRVLALGFAAAVTATSVLSAPPATSTETSAASPAVAATRPLRIQPWHLLQQDGAGLYGELCASCHGVAGAGNGPEAEALAVPAPALKFLRRSGVPTQHWTYVIQAGCDDHHHWAPDGSATMPCWQRLFRQALGNGAASLMVSVKLVDYLESIQE